MIIVANIEDIDEKLKELAQSVSNPTGKLWLMTVPKAYLLDLDWNLFDSDRDENFVRLKRRFLRPKTPAWKIACECRKKPFPANNSTLPRRFLVPPPSWVKKAIKKRQPVYLFDLAATITAPVPKVWQQIGCIRDWFIHNGPNAEYTSLSFQDVATNAATWRDTGEAFNPKAELLKCDRPSE